MPGAFASYSALFFGIALMMAANGLQGSLLGLRASIEAFDTGVLGLVMSGYYAGFLAGSLYAPRVVPKVGHIRVFAALASLASISILVHSIFIEPWIWGAMRVVTGFCYAGLYVVCESWLNNMSDNSNRGRLLSVYMVVQLGAVAGGQYLLGLADPSGANLFMLTAVLVSLAVLPLCLSANRAPEFTQPETLGIRELIRLSPLGSAGMALCGVAQGGLFGFGAIYAQRSGFTVTEIATFMAIIYLGGMFLQWPIGRMSDMIDRRLVILVVTLAATAVAVFGAVLPSPEPLSVQPGGPERVIWPFLLVGALFGGLCIPHYSLFIAHVNDRVPKEKIVAAAGGLVFLNGFGAIFGPNLAAAAMNYLGSGGFFISLGVMHGLIGLLTGYRMLRRRAPKLAEQADFVAMPVRGTALASALPEGWGPEEDDPEADTQTGANSGAAVDDKP